jgi:hypothetical protein
MSRYAFLLMLGAFSAACAAQSTARVYNLETVDGNKLPAIWNVSGSDTSWVHWGRVMLEPHGRATIVDSTTHTYHGVRAGGGMNTLHARYTIHSDSIEIGAPKTCTVPCFQGHYGRISDSTLTLTLHTRPATFWPVYRYRVIAPH